jgi:hypothetical protein
MASLFYNQIFDKPRTRHNGGTENARTLRVHVRALPPTIIEGHEFKADFVFKHMWRRVNLNVHCTPQRHSHGCAIRTDDGLFTHELFSPSAGGRI